MNTHIRLILFFSLLLIGCSSSTPFEPSQEWPATAVLRPLTNSHLQDEEDRAHWARLRALPRPTADVVRSTHIIIGSFVSINFPHSKTAHSSRLMVLSIREVLDGEGLLPGTDLQVSEPTDIPIGNLSQRNSGKPFVLFLTFDGCEYTLVSEMFSPSSEDIRVLKDLIARRMTLPEVGWVKALLKADERERNFCGPGT